MVTPQTLSASGTLAITSTGSGSAHILIVGNAASVIVMEMSGNGTDWVSANPSGVDTLVNLPFAIDFSQGFSYRLTNDATADAEVSISPR